MGSIGMGVTAPPLLSVQEEEGGVRLLSHSTVHTTVHEMQEQHHEAHWGFAISEQG